MFCEKSKPKQSQSKRAWDENSTQKMTKNCKKEISTLGYLMFNFKIVFFTWLFSSKLVFKYSALSFATILQKKLKSCLHELDRFLKERFAAQIWGCSSHFDQTGCMGNIIEYQHTAEFKSWDQKVRDHVVYSVSEQGYVAVTFPALNVPSFISHSTKISQETIIS